MKKKTYGKVDGEKFLELYKSGKTFKEIAKELNNIEVNVHDYYYEHYFAWERLEIDRERHKNLHSKEG